MDSAVSRLPARESQPSLRALSHADHVPFANGSLDLFVSVLRLHHVNDLVGALMQARAALKPDGLFIAALFGEKTLCNLRACLYEAETEIKGGVAPRISPFATIQDLGGLLSKAGFALPVADIDHVRVDYPNPLSLLQDLRGMGETSALKMKAPALCKKTLARTMDLFADKFGYEQFDIVYLTGWSPHESQQKPLKPGSAKHSLENSVLRTRAQTDNTEV